MKKASLALASTLIAAIMLVGAGCSNSSNQSSYSNPYVTSSYGGGTTDNTNNSQSGAGANVSTSPTSTIPENAARTPDLFTFAAGEAAANYLTQLQSTSTQFTVFAPTNDAFNTLPSSTTQLLLGANNLNNRQTVFGYYIVNGSHALSDLTEGTKLKTIEGDTLIIGRSGNDITVNGAKILNDGIQSSNGIIYIIDQAIFPSSFQSKIK